MSSATPEADIKAENVVKEEPFEDPRPLPGTPISESICGSLTDFGCRLYVGGGKGWGGLWVILEALGDLVVGYNSP